MTIVESRAVAGGVDTHLDTHVAAALDGIGGLLGCSRSRPPPPATGCSSTGSSFGTVEIRLPHNALPGSEAAAIRPRPGEVVYATRIALRELGRRAEYLAAQIDRVSEPTLARQTSPASFPAVPARISAVLAGVRVWSTRR